MDALRRAVAAERVAHAYLFHGPDGAGKRAAALALGRALLCERRGSPGVPDDDGCGRCLACTKAGRLVHPDLHVLFPRPSDADAADVAVRVRRLAEEPYAAVDYRRLPTLDGKKGSNKQAFYSVGLVNDDLRRVLSLRPAEGRKIVAVVTDAEAMRAEAANAFLKLLEEPRPHVVLVLTAERPDRVLPTILSRCQRVRFDPLAPEDVEAALVSRAAVASDRAALVARLSDGSYTRALSLLEGEDLQALRERALGFTRACFAMKPDAMPALIEQAAALGREPLKGLLSQMLSWVRDLVLVRAAGAGAPLVNVDQAEAIRRFVDGLPNARLETMAEAVEEAASMLDRNVHSGLLMTSLAFALHDAMHGRMRAALVTPLTEPVVPSPLFA